MDPTSYYFDGMNHPAPDDPPVVYFQLGLSGWGDFQLYGQKPHRITPGKAFFFRERTGLTPAHFATQVRVHEAARMLIETRLPLKAIAAACGFANANHFSKAFRRLQHLSPASYRRTMR